MSAYAGILVPLAFLALWIAICTGIRRVAGFGSAPDLVERRRRASDASGWASARIGGLAFNNCLKAYRVEDGFLLQLMPIFVGGYRWIADDEIIGRREIPRAWLRSAAVELSTRTGTITLSGSAAELVRRHPPRPPG